MDCKYVIAIVMSVALFSCQPRVNQRQLLEEADSLIEVHEGLQALELLTQAVELDDSTRLTAVAYNQMGSIFLEQGMTDLALKSFLEAWRIDSLANDTTGMVYDLRDIGNVYRSFDSPDSCVHYFIRARELAAALGDTLLLTDVGSQLAGYYLNANQPDSARSLLMDALALADEESLSGLCFMAADYYRQTGQSDSAEMYYRRLADEGNIYTQQAAHRALADICLGDREIETVLNHLKQYETLTDSIIALNDNEAMRRYNALYNYQKHQREAQRLKAANQRNHLYIALSALAVFVLVLALIALQLYFSRRQLRYKLRIKQLEQLLKQSRLVDDSELLGRLRQKPICAEILRDKQGAAPLSTSQWQKVEQAVNSVYEGFSEQLYGFCSLNDFEYHVCLLLKLGVSPQDIALFTSHSKQAVSTVRSRLYKKAFGQKGSSRQWDEVIASLGCYND